MEAGPELEERIRKALESLQHSHVEITQTTRGPTFNVKVRDPSPTVAAQQALELYRLLKQELGIEDVVERKSIAKLIQGK